MQSWTLTFKINTKMVKKVLQSSVYTWRIPLFKKFKSACVMRRPNQAKLWLIW